MVNLLRIQKKWQIQLKYYLILIVNIAVALFAILCSLHCLKIDKLIEKLEAQMKKAASELNFEEAMMLRDAILEIKADMR